MRTRKTVRACLGASMAVAVSVALTACSSSTSSTPTTRTNPRAARPAGSWPEPNGDLANSRSAAGSTISSANVASPQQAWTFKLPAAEVPSGPNGVAVAGGIVYGDTMTTAFALNARTGQTIWVDRGLLGTGQGTLGGFQPQVADGRVYLASAIAGNAVLVPAGGPGVFGPKGGSPQLVAYTVG